MAALLIGQFPRPHHQLERNPFGIRPLIDALTMQDMPDHHQQLARERDNRLFLTNPARETLEFGLPIRVGARGCLRRLYQHPAEFPPTFLGDPPGSMGFAAKVYRLAQYLT